jgi:hypothetical protein
MWKSGSYLQINESYDIPRDWLEPAHDDQYGQALYLKATLYPYCQQWKWEEYSYIV